MSWYGKYEDDKEEKSFGNKKKEKEKEVRLTARYCNGDGDGEIIVHDNYEDEDIALTKMRGND